MEDIDFRTLYMEIEDKNDRFQIDREHYGERCCDFEQHFEISWIYHENALDGVVLTFHEIKAALDEKIVSDVKLIPTYQGIKNHRDCIAMIRKAAVAKRSKLNLEFVKKLHEQLCVGNDRAKPGEFRQDIPLHRSYFHDITVPAEISTQLSKLLQGAGSETFRRWHPVKQASAFHHEFMRIFPFSNHSGKIGRLLLNYFLLRGGLVPAVIHSVDRQRYYESLKEQPTVLRQLVLEALNNALESGLRYLQEYGVEPKRAVGFSH